MQMEHQSAFTHRDEGVWNPVGRGNLVSEPGGDCFGGLDAELGERLGYEAHAIQKTLGSVVVVFEKAIGLGRIKQEWEGENHSSSLLSIFMYQSSRKDTKLSASATFIYFFIYFYFKQDPQ